MALLNTAPTTPSFILSFTVIKLKAFLWRVGLGLQPWGTAMAASQGWSDTVCVKQAYCWLNW